MSTMSDLRDEVYTRIAAKKVLEDFTFNNFTVVKSHRPYERIELLPTNYPGGKVYVVAGTPGVIQGRSRSNIALGELAVVVGFQKGNIDLDDLAANDTLLDFVEELADMCRLEVTPAEYSFQRLEFLQDDNGVPYDFFGMRDAHLFESYFTAFYLKVAQP